CSVEITNPALDNLEFALYANLNKKGLCLHYEKRRKLLFISDEDLENTQGYTFKQECEEGLQTVKLFVDHGLVEILINDDQVYTLYIYPNKNERLIRMGGNDISLVIKGK
ncbi:MAG: GH32 C-terminal domain-containing protein, partial [Solobacterium sp.]|nr:GH32 C-terminal domain-containing protein [Solobacterium sp.]